MRLPKLTDEEIQQVDEILCKCKSETTNQQFAEDSLQQDDTSNYYQLSGNEKQRLADLNAALGVSDDTINAKLPHSPRVKFAENLPTKTSSQKMMRRTDRKRINYIDTELDKMALEHSSSACLSAKHLEFVEGLNTEDYSQFKAKRIVNYALNIKENEQDA